MFNLSYGKGLNKLKACLPRVKSNPETGWQLSLKVEYNKEI